MSDLLAPLADLSTFEAQSSRPPVKFSILFKQTLKLQFLLRRRKQNYYLSYIIGVFFTFFFLFLAYLPMPTSNDDPHPTHIDQSKLLSYTKFFFSRNSSYLYITSKNKDNAIKISEDMFEAVNYEFLPNINEVSKKVINSSTSSSSSFGIEINIDPPLNHADSTTDHFNSISVTTINPTLATYSGSTFINSFFEYFADKYLPNTTFSLAYRYFAHPSSNSALNVQFVAIIYFIISHALILLSSIVLYYTLNSSKLLFLLEINGVTNKVRFYVILVTLIIEHLPVNIISTVLFCFIGPTTKGTNFFLFFVSDYLFTLSLFAIQIFFQPLLHSKGSSTAFCTILILFFVLFEYFIMFQQYIPKIAYQVILCLFPPASFIGMSNLMIQRKGDLGPMSFSSLDYKFNGVSGHFTLSAQAISTLLYVIMALLGNLCNPNCYGKPPLGWSNLFKIGAWKKMLSKSRRRPLISINRKSSNFNQTANEFANSQESLTEAVREFDTTKCIIEFDSLKKTYKPETKALDSVSLKISQGEFIVMIGSNGSGKTTLLTSVIGAINVDEGMILFYGEELKNDFDEILYPELGVAFQENVLFGELTVEEHFQLFGGLSGFSENQTKSDMNNLLNILKMGDMMHTKCDGLSGGSKRKLSVALSLLKKPAVVVLDEPTAGVDAQSRQLIWKVVNDFTGATVITACHSVEECESISTRLLLMSKGQIAFVGTAAEMREKYNCCYFVTVIENEDVDMQKVLECANDVEKARGRVRISSEHKNTLMIPNNLHFADILWHIDENKERLGIRKYTVQVENLEETMRKIIEDEEALIQQ
ncbi:hypothetical protein M9Y10_042219 [Tritrichomonas musculus]|uniref:ABC transporter domain-containing protein n=1 Tax=Tritrichomonas musculus TaxID=1915356 RepID=A0ABR2K6K1_9EUKA